jgi:hypothetical protein
MHPTLDIVALRATPETIAALAETLDFDEDLRRYSWGYTGLLLVVIVLGVLVLVGRRRQKRARDAARAAQRSS